MGYFGPFWPNLGQRRIFPKNRSKSLLSLYGPLTSCKVSEKTNVPIPRKMGKSPFLGYFGPFWPNLGQTRIFPKNRAPSDMSLYGPLTSCKVSEKSNEPIPRKVPHPRTHKGEFIGPHRSLRKRPGVQLSRFRTWYHLQILTKVITE